MINEDRMAILEGEVYVLRDSGEIPEIALHSSIHFLTTDPEGPQMHLDREELAMLQDAALERSREIVLRDLGPENRDLGIYRGPRRSIYNWQRMQDFCRRINRDCSPFTEKLRRACIDFFQQELADVRSGRRTSSVNCTVQQLLDFFGDIGLTPDLLPAGWQDLCCR